MPNTRHCTEATRDHEAILDMAKAAFRDDAEHSAPKKQAAGDSGQN